MTLLSLSTMWAQQDRFADIGAFREAAAALGYDAIEVSHSTNGGRLEALLTEGGLPLSSLHAPTPLDRIPDGRWNSEMNLAAVDETERQGAVATTRLTIDHARRAGIKRIVVHLGGVGARMFDAERQLRRLYDSGKRDGDEVNALREAARREREAGAAVHFEAARRSLQELVEYAAPDRIALGLENRFHYHEIPSPDEAAALLADYTNAEAGYWHDVGHAEVLARLGLVDRHAWFPRLTSRTIGSHLHDVDGLADHRAPGNGDVDWSYLAAGIPKDALHTLEINQGQPDDVVGNARTFLRERGVID
jgi:sugar phosphate isomerase/epimerase